MSGNSLSNGWTTKGHLKLKLMWQQTTLLHSQVLNGKPPSKLKKEKLYRRNKEEINQFRTPFTKDEVQNVIKLLKNREAAEIDVIQSEQIKQFSPETVRWRVKMFNVLVSSGRISAMWKKAHCNALSKTVKKIHKTLRTIDKPLSLLCHLMKVLRS